MPPLTHGPALRRCGAALLFLLGLALVRSAGVFAQSNDDCLACHSDATLKMERKGRSVSIHVDPAILARSPHASLSCTDCHAGFDPSNLPHKTQIAPVDCQSCHGDVSGAHQFHAPGVDVTAGRRAGAGRGEAAGETRPGPASTAGGGEARSTSVGVTAGAGGRGSAAAGGTPAEIASGTASGNAKGSPAGSPTTIGPKVAPDTDRQGTRLAAAPTSVPAGPASSASCKTCHGTHAITAIDKSDPKTHIARLEEFCGRCHGEVVVSYRGSEHGKAAGAGVRGAPGCLTCHDKPVAPPPGSGETAERKVGQEKLCLSCHLDDPGVRARMAPGAGFIAAYEKSVHGSALLAGNAKAANCVDCHGSHEMRHGLDPASRVNKIRIPLTCAKCHGEIAEQYESSVHGLAIKRGNTEAPVCTDCHGEHDIKLHTDPASPVAFANLSARVCTPCHSSVKLSTKYDFPADRSRSFEDSFHGLAIRGGSAEVANCASCHGSHNIRPSSDPGSTINKANLAATCGKCHQGANDRFAKGAVHVVMTAKQEPLLYWISALYVGMIVVTVGGMFAHNLLDYGRKTLARLRNGHGAAPEVTTGRALYLRMSVTERIQHASLMVSFTLLAVTGFMLRYPDAWWVAWIRSLSTHAFETRSLVHRIAAVVMVTASLAHIAYVTFTARGRRLIRDIFPRRQDLYDVLGMLGWNLGVSRKRPRFGRFGYVEKSEYWALVWGTIVMAATGGVLWFENTFIGLLSKLGYDVARTVHFYEAILATLAIVVWHLYFVIFNPDIYPMNTAWITGKLTEAQMADEHPLELEAIQRERDDVERRALLEAEKLLMESAGGGGESPAAGGSAEVGRAGPATAEGGGGASVAAGGRTGGSLAAGGGGSARGGKTAAAVGEREGDRPAVAGGGARSSEPPSVPAGRVPR